MDISFIVKEIKRIRDASRKKVEKPLPQPEKKEVATTLIDDRFSSYPSNGLTPEKLASIFREADSGDILRQAELFEEMEEKDPHLFSQLQTRKNAVTGLDYEVIPFSEDEQDKEISEFVSNQLKSLEGLEDIMLDLLDAIGKGMSVSEILWGYEDGHTVIKDVKHRHLKRFFWDMEDVLKVITKEHSEGIPLPANKFIIHRYKARSGHPARAGVLRVVAWMYLFKNYTVKDWVAFCEVFGMPLRLGKYNASASEADKLALMEALVQIGTDAAGIIPEGTEIEFKEAAKISSLNVYESLARYCDEQTSKAILGQTLTSDSGGGSYAQSKTHNDVRHDLTIADCKALAATLRRDLIRPLVFFNFGEERRIPYIRFDCEESEDLKEAVDIFKTLICEIGLPVSESHLYKKFSIPKPDEDEAIVRPAQGMNFMDMKEDARKAKSLKSSYSSGGRNQKELDELADVATKESQATFRQIFQPLKELASESESLEDILVALDDQATVDGLMEEMAGADLESQLHKAMFLADLKGRAAEDG